MNRLARIITASAAGLLIIGLTIGVIVLDDQKNNAEIQLRSVYDKSMQELSSDLQSLKTKLDKLEAAVGSQQRNILLMDVWRQTGDIQDSISDMPVSYVNTSTLTQFINRTGDYSYTLCQKLAAGEDISEEDVEQIKELAKSCGDIETCLSEQQNEFALSSDAFLSTEDSNLDFTNQQYARLQYDGPFSESTENKEPLGLGDETVDEETAKTTAAEFLDLKLSELTTSAELNGKIECFGFSGEKDGNPFSIYISKTGGKVLWYMSQHQGGITAVPTNAKYSQLTKKAQEFLKQKGFGETAASYAQFYDGMAVINLAPVQNDVVLYPDLIKVWMDISKLEVVGVDANNYLMSHVNRNLGDPQITKDEAKLKLTQDIVVSKTRLALIPKDNGEEVMCYEFTGQVGEHDYIIYINADSGSEEDILMIQHTNEGTLVM